MMTFKNFAIDNEGIWLNTTNDASRKICDEYFQLLSFIGTKEHYIIWNVYIIWRIIRQMWNKH